MSLLDLSNELLASILSFDDALDYDDLFNIFMTCQRLNLVTLPFLYRSIRILALNLREPSRDAFEEIVGHFNRYPERRLWVKKVRASWYRQNNKGSTALFNLLFSFSAMHSLTMCASGPWDEDPAFQMFLDNCNNCTSVQHLSVANPHSDWSEAVRLFAMPNLETLVLRNFDFNLESAMVPGHSYKPTKLKEIVIPMTTYLPMGLQVQSILRNHPYLKTLVWIVNHELSPPISYPHDVLRALAPLLPTLESLTLLLREPSGFYKINQMDFSGFTALKLLEIKEKFTFGKNFLVVPPGPPFHRGDLSDRLPRTLENLKIWFGHKSWALRLQRSGPLSYSWLLHLALQKQFSFTRLTSVKLLEVKEWLFFKRPEAAPMEWDYPSDVTEIFGDAEIHLQVILKPECIG